MNGLEKLFFLAVLVSTVAVIYAALVRGSRHDDDAGYDEEGWR